MKKIKFLMTSIFLLISLISFSQDKIYLKNGKELNVKIIEKSDKEVKYKLIDESDSPIIIINSHSIEKIIFRNGEEMKLLSDETRMSKRICLNVGLRYGLGIEDVFYKFQADYFITPAINLEL